MDPTGNGTMSITTIAALTGLYLFAATMTYAGIRDLTTMTITNRLVLFLLAAYLVLAPVAGIAVETIVSSAVLALAVLLGALVLFARGWIGGGDAKLAVVTILWLGPDLAMHYLVYTAMFGGLLTLAILQFRRMPLPVFLQNEIWPARLHAAGSGVPYGVAMASAALLLIPETEWLRVFQ